MTSTYLLALFALLAIVHTGSSSDAADKWKKKLEYADEGLAIMEKCGDDDMRATAAKLRNIEKEVIEAIETAKESLQKFINIPSIVLKDTVMKGMKGLVESSGTVFKTAQKAIDSIKQNIPKVV